MGKQKIHSIDCRVLHPSYKWIIVPDLHGEYEVLEEAIKKATPDDKFIFLGDIVDRGPSAFKTFNLVWELINKGKAYGVISNHDNKFYRWCKKYLDHIFNNGELIYSPFVQNSYSLGMQLSHGLNKTVQELLDMDKLSRLGYAEAFIQYYESLSVYATLRRENQLHIFAHAGISKKMLDGEPLGESSNSTALYRTLSTLGELYCMDQNVEQDLYVHLGHESQQNCRINIKSSSNIEPKRFLLKHDIGLGKVPINLLKQLSGGINFMRV